MTFKRAMLPIWISCPNLKEEADMINNERKGFLNGKAMIVTET